MSANNSITVKENKMGTWPIGKLLFSMALPMIISMIIQAMYNIVDSIYVSSIDEYALTAVSISFPIQTLIVAIASGTCVGVNALLSKSLGEKNHKMASMITQNGIFLGLMGGVLFAILSFIIVSPFMAAQTAAEGTNPLIYEYGCSYLSIICLCAVAIFMEFTFERLLNSTGKTSYTMISQTTGAVINLILDPIMIFNMNLGVSGAAIATVTGQFIAAMLALTLNIKKNKEISLSMKNFRPSPKIISMIYKIGIPSIVMVAIMSVMTFGLNLILMGFTSTATAAFGIYSKLNSMVFNPIFGINNALVPIIAFNYGAQHKLRMKKTLLYSRITAMAIMGVGTLLLWIIPQQLLLLFNASEDMLSIGVNCLRIISLSFIPAGYAIITSSTLQAVGESFYSMICSICRQLLVLLPCAYIFSKLWGLEAVWYSYLVAEVVSLIIISLSYRKVYNKKIASLPD